MEAELARAADLLRGGGVVAFPTDTIYGLGALADNSVAIDRIFKIKGRPITQALPLLAADEAQAVSVTRFVPETAKLLMARFWPGALTLVLPRAIWMSEMITAGGLTIAVRVPDHPLTIALIEAAGGPLVGTSANIHGHPNPITAGDVQSQLGNSVDLIIDGGQVHGGTESTVVDVTVNPPRIIRQGAIAKEEIEQVVEITSN